MGAVVDDGLNGCVTVDAIKITTKNKAVIVGVSLRD